MRGAATLSANLEAEREAAGLYRRLATLRTDVPMTETVGDLEWRGARRPAFEKLCEVYGSTRLAQRVDRWMDR